MTYGLKGIRNTAVYLDEKLSNWNAPPKLGAQAPVLDQTGAIVSLSEITDASWDKAQAVLMEAIFEKDKRLTITLCERMAGSPYLTSSAHRDAVSTPTATI